MKILHINASDISGGAARAAYRIHRSQVEHGAAHGLSSQMRVIEKQSDDPTVLGGMPVVPRSPLRKLQRWQAQREYRQFKTGNPVLHSTAWPGTGLGKELQLAASTAGDDSVLHLHWLGSNTLSIEEIGALPRPVVWTCHDQWPFCGAEHYTSPPLPGESDSSDERFAVGYPPASRPAHEAGPDLNRLTWLRKSRAWRRSINIICPSQWLADCARRSALMGAWPITVIPYPIDLNVWAPWDQAQARALLGLPPERPLVLFGAIGGSADPRKGADLLMEALQRLRSQVAGSPLEQLQLLVFGQSRPVQPPELGFQIHYSGSVQDDLRLRLLYAAADVMVVPSRQEAFGQTASEAQACGTPVVAFATGGLVDIVDDRVSGALAEPFDPASLAAAIRWVLEDPLRRRTLGVAARQRAERLWDPKRVAQMYADLYASCFDASLLE